MDENKADLPGEVRESRTAAPLEFFKSLFFTPRRFFEDHVLREHGLYLLAAAYFVGLAEAFSRTGKTLMEFDSRDAKSESMERVLETLNRWEVFWPLCLGLAVGCGAFYFYVGGWFYMKRVQWCDGNTSKTVCRRFYTYTAFIPSAVTIVMTIVKTLTDPAPLKHEAESGFYLALMVLWLFSLYWSIYASYAGVRLLAKPRRKTMTMMWFAVLPSVMYTAVFAPLVLSALLFAARG